MRGENSTVRKVVSEKEGTGVSTGLSERSDFMADKVLNDADYNVSASGATGRSTAGGGYYRGVKGKRGSTSVSSKGYSFEIEGCGGSEGNPPL